MDGLRAEYLSGAAARLARARADLDALAFRPGDEGALARLRRELHGFAGSGTSYGFPGVTRLGRDGEAACLGTGTAGPGVPPALLGRLREILDLLEAELAGKETPAAASANAGTAPGSALAAPPRVVAVATADPDVRRVLEPLLAQQGIEVEGIGSLEELALRIRRPLPDGLVLDDDLAGAELVAAVRAAPGGDAIAIACVGRERDFLQEVGLLRAGADAWFARPIQAPLLLRRLMLLLEPEAAGAPRILSVEDDPAQAEFIRLVLESAGYEVRGSADPSRFEADLVQFRPDLVLLDLDLPGVSGHDLARFVRQSEGRQDVPVVFLTADAEVATRVRSARAGGDEHLVKPVAPGLLLTTVAARLERARFLRSLLDRDRLTMLLSPAAFLERATQAVARARRKAGSEAQWAVLEVDDLAGHSARHGARAAERLLVTVASLLRQRLRLTEAVGRSSESRFGVLFEGTGSEAAAGLLEPVRAAFAALEHPSPAGPFRATLSAGIASFAPSRTTVAAWEGAAAKALGEARAAGGDRVVAAA